MQIKLIFTRKVFHLASAHFGSKSFWNSAMVYVYSVWGLSPKVVNAFFVFTLGLFCLF